MFPSVLLARVREHGEADEHADAGRAESPVPAYPFAERTGHDLPEERSGVDAHVEDREPGVASRAAFRVKIANDC